MAEKIMLLLLITILSFAFADNGAELVYAEMEFPLSFVSQVRQYQFNPLSRFQTQVEGRLLELTCDPLVDVFQDKNGRQIYRPCLASFQTVSLRDRSVLSFNLAKIPWIDNSSLSFDDVWFSLEYRKLNPDSWQGNRNLTIVAKGENSFDAYYGDNTEAPKPGEFYFPIVSRKAYRDNNSPAQAKVDKSRQDKIGYGRYQISEVEENRYIHMQRRREHPFYKNLKWPSGVRPIDNVRMFSFPNARITRNEQFINGRLHLLTSATQMDVGYISNALGAKNVAISRYTDDSFSGFVFHCRHPYLAPPAVRRAFNYLTRKELMLRKALGGEGDLISGPIPRRNYFYNLTVPVYADSENKAMALLKLYRYWGLDIYENQKGLKVCSDPIKGPCSELQAGDFILEVENTRVRTLEELVAELDRAKEGPCRLKIARDKRVYVKVVQKGTMPQVGIWSSAHIVDGKIQGFPELTLIANNPEGKNPLIKQVCGALKEDLARVGIVVKINYLDGKNYYPKLQSAEFDLAFRTLKLTGTPNLHRMFFHQKEAKEIANINYGRYSNESINEIASSTRDITDKAILTSSWKRAHQELNEDPPYIFLWSRRHIVMHDPKLTVIDPNTEYEVPHGYKQINGLISIFNEVHLWGMRD